MNALKTLGIFDIVVGEFILTYCENNAVILSMSPMWMRNFIIISFSCRRWCWRAKLSEADAFYVEIRESTGGEVPFDYDVLLQAKV